jgi:hypothetical protein
MLTAIAAQTEVLAGQVEQRFGQHRYIDAKRGRTTPTCPRTPTHRGTKRVVLARFAYNRRLGDAMLQGFAAAQRLPGARALTTGNAPAEPPTTKPLPTLANRLVGILHGPVCRIGATRSAVRWWHESPRVYHISEASGRSRTDGQVTRSDLLRLLQRRGAAVPSHLYQSAQCVFLT